MSNNVAIAGTQTNPPNTPFTASVRGKIFYDGIGWTQSGTLMWDAENKVIYVQPSATKIIPTQPKEKDAKKNPKPFGKF